MRMAAVERHAMDPAQDETNLQATASASLDLAEGPRTSGMLDPLVRALDRAVARSAQPGSGCANSARPE